LLVSPAAGLSLDDKLAVTQLLLASGATIYEVNTVRKHLSRVKGGGLARWASPATVLGFILSDVIGDDLATIGSGPTVPDPSTFADVWDILTRYDLLRRIPEAVATHLAKGRQGSIPETAKPGSFSFANVYNYLIGSNRSALAAAAATAWQFGFDPQILSTPLSGDSRDAARMFAQTVRLSRESCRTPVCLLAGGETTVRVTGVGKGGRNQEFALVVAHELQREEGWSMLSAGTDGIDGPTDAAGAFVDGHTVDKAKSMGFDPQSYLGNNDTYSLFARLGNLFISGPTGTNVMDIKIVLLHPHPMPENTI
jgi:hydroxypyruvate reductase